MPSALGLTVSAGTGLIGAVYEPFEGESFVSSLAIGIGAAERFWRDVFYLGLVIADYQYVAFMAKDARGSGQ